MVSLGELLLVDRDELLPVCVLEGLVLDFGEVLVVGLDEMPLAYSNKALFGLSWLYIP
jgi:hypothetical protein